MSKQQKITAGFAAPMGGSKKSGAGSAKTPAPGQAKISNFFVKKEGQTPGGTPAAAAAAQTPASGRPNPVATPGPAQEAGNTASKHKESDANHQAVRTPAAAPSAAPAAAAVQKDGKSGAQGKDQRLSGGAELVGKRVKVYWPDDKAWYKGTFEMYEQATAKHKVLYDDGEEEWVALSQERVKLLGSPTSNKSKKSSKHKPSAKRRRNVVVSEDEDAGMAASDDGGADESSVWDEGEDSDGSEDVSGLVDDNEGASGEDEAMADLEDDISPTPGGAKKRKRSGGKAAAKQTPAAARNGGASSAAALTPGTPFTPAGRMSKGGERDACTTGGRTPGGTGGTTRAPRSTPAPPAGAASSLKKALDNAYGSSAQAAGAGPAVVQGVRVSRDVFTGEAARFLQRMAQRFPFMHPDKIMDAQRRRPDHPDYDPRTLYIPPNWFTENKISAGQQQWWTFKSTNFDSVLLFKMGKFYEMFEMDAYVGVDVLGLQFMKGDQPHAGFPEARYHDNAESLARSGYRVVVVEQTETPEQLAERNKELKRQGKKQAGVVNRDKVAVISRGTLVDAEMVAARPDASYTMAVFEMACPGSEPAPEQQPGSTQAGAAVGGGTPVVLGLCAVDAASGQVLLGQFTDDEVRSTLRTHLTALQPVELVLPRAMARLSTTTQHVLRAALRDPRLNELRGRQGDWDAHKAVKAMEGYLANEQGVAEWPQALDSVRSEPDSNRAALSALHGMVVFLRDSLLDKAVLPLGRVEQLPVLQSQDVAAALAAEPLHMVLNASALENLEVIENQDGGSTGTLLAVLDHCTSPFGRRKLRQWLCRPLFRAADIVQRQDAVADLMDAGQEACGRARKHLAGISDLERAVMRLHATTVDGALGREAAGVVLYEDAAKRRVKGLVAAITDLQSLCAAVREFREAGPLFKSDLLQRLLGLGPHSAGAGEKWEKMEAVVLELLNATDWKEAEKTGRVMPARGVDARYDAAQDSVEEVKRELQDHLKQVRQELGCRDVAYVSQSGKADNFAYEVPESVKVPRTFDLAMGSRKGFKRYTSEDLKDLVARLEERKDEAEQAMGSILQGLVRRFVEAKDLWMWSLTAVSELDALMSLAAHALHSGVEMCRPQVIPYDGPDAPAFFEARELRHPACISGRDGGSFVPNDVTLGASGQPGFIMISGPNMGGKSTMLRQVCLATILAQVGACVPAASVRMTPVDALFVRMGARDAIMLGESTFFVELSEAAGMLNKATRRSLVVLDELGRGTATLDGAAIAGAVLQRLAQGTRCRGLFATHYHHLSDDHASDPSVAIMHMACAVSGGEADAGAPPSSGAAVQEVTFLYKLTHGPCPRSYGTNVARLAGLPSSVVTRASQVASQAEEGAKAAAAQAQAAEQTSADASIKTGAAGAVAPMDIDAECAAAPDAQQQRHTLLGVLRAAIKAVRATDSEAKAAAAGEARAAAAALVGA